MMLTPRRLMVATSTVLVLVGAAAGLVSTRPSNTASARARSHAASVRLDARLAGADDATRAIALAYLERARLGLGSPYRLIDQAIHDRRLTDSIRHDVAWSLVGAIMEGRSYEIDPLALDMVSQPGAGAAHLALIESAIASTENPRVAEVTVRIAYALAAANGAAAPGSVPAVAEAAAQVRDRVLAARDLRRAVSRAKADGLDLIDEVIHLRTTRELAVEQPVMRALTGSERAAAIDGAPALLRRIEAVAASSPGERGAAQRLDKDAALALARLAPRRPPLAAVRVLVASRARTLKADSMLHRSAAAVVGEAANEESLIAAFAYADRLSNGRSHHLHRLVLSAGVALRAHAQDQVWFAQDGTPTSSAIVRRFGLRSIAFDPAVPSVWRPFYVHMIASALDDFARAVPGHDPAGLSFRVEMKALPDSALAIHDPRSRTIRLSAMTPSGTLAHELAHDVDWRAARQLFAKSGGYATDRSQKESAMRLSSSVRGLTSARIAGRGRVSPDGSTRPAEVFARSVDWFTADVLSHMGRSNGYLSAIEDPLLAGFAALPGDAPTEEMATSLVRSLAEMTFVPDSLTAPWVGRWESLDVLDPATIVLRATDAPMDMRRPARPPFGMTPAVMTNLATGSLCVVDAMREGSPQERLLALAIDARARGIVVRRARHLPEATRPAWARAVLDAPLVEPAAATDIMRRTTAAVAEGVARSGLFQLPQAPFRHRCGR